MKTVKISDQISSSHTIKGFRSLRHCTGAPLATLDAGRISLGEARRQWNGEKVGWKMRQETKCPIRVGIRGGAHSIRGLDINGNKART